MAETLTLDKRLDNVIRWLALFGGSDDSAVLTLRQVQTRLAELERVAAAARERQVRPLIDWYLPELRAALDALEAAEEYGVWGCTDDGAERCRLRCALLDAQDEYAALAAGLDAVVAEAEHYGSLYQAEMIALTRQAREAFALADDWRQRADAAEAQLGAEYAALAAGLDAVVAEYEFRRDGLTAAWQQMHIAYKLAAARADAAEAQLGTAREDGARSMLAFVARHGFCDRERFLLIRIDADKDDWPLGWRSTAPTEADTVLAVWRGHETKEGRGGD